MRELVDRLLLKVREEKRHVVVIGDTMVDRWVIGRVEDCQEGCPKFVQESVDEVPGGAGNAARSLENWGANVALYGWASNDCPVKTRYVADGKILFRADEDSLPGSFDRRNYQWARDLAMEMVQCAGAVLLSDYDKGFLTPEFVRHVAEVCARRGVPCVADAKREPEVYAGCIIKGNADYFSRYATRARRLDTMSITTHGAANTVVWDSGEVVLSPQVFLPQVNCVNHVGAGDCFAAHLTLALAHGFSLKEAAALAHAAGRVYVQYPHNRPPHPAEIAEDLAGSSESPASPRESKPTHRHQPPTAPEATPPAPESAGSAGP